MATVLVRIDGSTTPAATVTTPHDTDDAWTLPNIGPLLQGLHTLDFVTQPTGDVEGTRRTITVTSIVEEEGKEMPAHTVNESTGTAGATAATVDPTPNAKRYKVVLVNLSGTDVVWVGYSASVAVGSGHMLEANYGEREFFVDSNQRLYAIRGGSTNVSVRAFEYCTA